MRINEYEVRVTARTSLSEEALEAIPGSLAGYYAAAGWHASEEKMVVVATVYTRSPWSAIQRIMLGLRSWATRYDVSIKRANVTCTLKREG